MKRQGLVGKVLAWRLARMDAKTQQLLREIAALSAKRANAVPQDGWLRPIVNSPGACCFGTGWSGFEDWGVWGLGHEHQMIFWLPGLDPLSHDLDIEIDVTAVFTAEFPTARVSCLVEGHCLHRHAFSDQSSTLRLCIPPEFVDRATGFVSTIFHFDHPICPAKLGWDASDGRELGLGVKRFRYRYGRKSAARQLA